MTPTAIVRGAEVLKRLPEGQVVGAEIGIFRGHMSHVLLSRPDLTLYMVDNWLGDERFPGYQLKDMPSAKSHAEKVTDPERRVILHMNSLDAANTIEDGFLDFVFIDADHSYKGCSEDIEAWRHKVKKGGLLGGHDYANPNFAFGEEVKRAVDEACEKYGWSLDRGRNKTWFVRV